MLRRARDTDIREARHAHIIGASAACSSGEIRRQDRADRGQQNILIPRARSALECARRQPDQAWRCARRPRHPLCDQFMGMAGQLLRGAEDRRRHQPHQRHAHARRGRLCDARLRRQGADRQPGQGRRGPRRVGRLLHQHRVRSGHAFGCTAVRRAHQPQCQLRCGAGCFRTAVDHRLYVGNHRSSQGGDAVASRRDPQRRDDSPAARQDIGRYGRHRTALPARLRQCRVQRRDDVRPHAGAASAFRRSRNACQHSNTSGHDV